MRASAGRRPCHGTRARDLDLDAGRAGDLGGQRVVCDGPALLVDELPAQVAQRGLVGRVEQVGEDRLGRVVGVQAPSVRADDADRLGDPADHELGPLLRRAAVGDVEHRAHIAGHLALHVAQRGAAHRNPANVAVGAQEAKLGVIAAARRGGGQPLRRTQSRSSGWIADRPA